MFEMNSFPQFNNSFGFLSLILPFHKVANYSDYKFKELSQEDIEKIYKINNTFLAHRERLLSALFQDAIKMNEFTFGNNIFRLCIKRFGMCEVGYWEYSHDSKNVNLFDTPYIGSYIFSSDIISLVATYYNYTFKEAIELIYSHITSNTTLYPHVKNGKGGYREELFPIAKKFDNVKINNNFIQQLEKSGAILSQYSLNNSIIFLYKYYYKNCYDQYVEIFFGYFHRHDSAQYTFIAMDISQINSLDFQCMNKLKYNTTLQDNIISFNNKFQKQIKFLLLDLPNDIRENKLSVLPFNFPYGIMIKNINHLYQFDFSTLKNHVIFLEIDKNYYKDKKILLSSLGCVSKFFF